MKINLDDLVLVLNEHQSWFKGSSDKTGTPASIFKVTLEHIAIDSGRRKDYRPIEALDVTQVLINTNLNGVRFNHCVFVECVFMAQDFSQTVFDKCLFDHCLFINCNVRPSLTKTCKLDKCTTDGKVDLDKEFSI